MGTSKKRRGKKKNNGLNKKKDKPKKKEKVQSKRKNKSKSSKKGKRNKNKLARRRKNRGKKSKSVKEKKNQKKKRKLSKKQKKRLRNKRRKKKLTRQTSCSANQANYQCMEAALKGMMFEQQQITNYLKQSKLLERHQSVPVLSWLLIDDRTGHRPRSRARKAMTGLQGLRQRGQDRLQDVRARPQDLGRQDDQGRDRRHL